MATDHHGFRRFSYLSLIRMLKFIYYYLNLAQLGLIVEQKFT